MITTYLLQDCKYCKELLKYIKKHPNLNIAIIMVSKDDIKTIKEKEPRIKQFPVAFTGSPTLKGLPYKNSHMIDGSETILNTLKNNFGKQKLTGSNIHINYDNDNYGNVTGLSNIRQHRNNCFGKSCYVMDRPYDSNDNQYILQGYQPPCASPIRSDLPIKYSNNYMNYFGMTTPGTPKWQYERKIWSAPKILVNDKNIKQNMNVNTMAGMNIPMTYSNDSLNRNSYGSSNKFVSGPMNQTYPFLTYGAGGNTYSRVHDMNYLPEQIPIQNQVKSSYLSGNLKKYAMDKSNHQNLLAAGFNSKWSSNGQGISQYGSCHKNKNKNHSLEEKRLVQTTFSSDMGNSGIAQEWKTKQFPKNGNGFGKKNTPSKSTKNNSATSIKSKKTKFTSPLGIEISFN